MRREVFRPGRIRKAPESFLDADFLKTIRKEGLDEERRSFLRKSFLAASAAIAAAPLESVLAADDPNIVNIPEWSKILGKPVGFAPYGQPSKYEKNVIRRESPGLSPVPQASVAFSPLQSIFGIVTPSGLHFERHHQGWVDIDPTRHRFMINGLVKNPRVYTMDDLMRLPSVSRFHFVECGANTAMEWGNVALPTVQYTHGMLSNSEWTGVLLSTLLEDAGIDLKRAKYLMAEGADGSSENRTINIENALDDVIVAYGQNGEMIRPEQGYPLRLLVPGVQGVSSIKWLRRIEVGDKPWSTKDETTGYADLMPDGRMRMYTSIQEAKSVITSPSGGQQLIDKGYYTITGVAWSGRGKIKRVDVSTDGGITWKTAEIISSIHSKSLTRFNFGWVWDGSPAVLQSRAIDETGYVQPTYTQLRKVRGTRGVYHNNAIQSWKIDEKGWVYNVQVA